MIYETDGTEERHYTRANGLLLAQQTGTTNIRYLTHDAQGTIRGMLSATGASLLESYDYNAFGDFYTTPTSMPTKFAYTGQQYDYATGLYFLRARYYDPAIGRFLSQDPYPVNTGNPIELNRYVYTANNPVNFSDPSGLTGLAEASTRSLQILAVAPLLLMAGVALIAIFLYIVEILDRATNGAVSDAAESATDTISTTAATAAAAATTFARTHPAIKPIVDTGIYVNEALGISDEDRYDPDGSGGGPKWSIFWVAAAFALSQATLWANLLTEESETDEKEDETHITLGLELSENRDRRLLVEFTRSLRGTSYVNYSQRVYHYRGWYDIGLISIPTDNTTAFNQAFREATQNANGIHFSLYGIDDPVEYAKTRGASREFPPRKFNVYGVPPGETWTGVELNLIISSHMCLKTTFYVGEPNAPVPISANEKTQLCNAGIGLD